MKILRTGIALAAVAALGLTSCAINETNKPSDNNTNSSSSTASSASDLAGKLSGKGASSAKVAQTVWISEFQKANSKVSITYAPEGSGAGRKAFTSGGANFAGSDRALKDDEMVAGNFNDNCKADTLPLNLPIYISPIAIAYHLEGVANLRLDAQAIAAIFAEKITNWNDPAIKALNPEATLPDLAITVVHRSDDSGTTDNFTQTMSQTANNIWTWKPSGEWPGDLGGEGAKGTSGVVAAVKNGEGTIGYADISGLAEGMTVVQYSKDGSGDFVGPTAEAAAAIVGASKKVEGRAENDWALSLDRNAAGYPFVLVSYGIACQEYKDAKIGKLVNAYFGYITSDKGQSDPVEQAGNAPLSGDLAKKVAAAAATIK